MSNWQLTKGLQNLRNQFNAAFPKRSKASDGTIGDLAHMAETSGHNPDDTPGSKAEYNDHDGIPEVRAWDVTSTLNEPGVTAQQVVDHLRKLSGIASVVRYMIYNRKIYEAANGWKAEAYTGPSAHTEHIHFSGARTQAADNNTTFDYRLEDLVDMTPDELLNYDPNDLAKGVQNPFSDAKTNPTVSVKTALYNAMVIPKQVHDQVTGVVLPQLLALSKAVNALAGKDVVDEGAIVTGVLAGITAAGRSVDDVAADLIAALGDQAPAVAQAILAQHPAA